MEGSVNDDEQKSPLRIVAECCFEICLGPVVLFVGMGSVLLLVVASTYVSPWWFGWLHWLNVLWGYGLGVTVLALIVIGLAMTLFDFVVTFVGLLAARFRH